MRSSILHILLYIGIGLAQRDIVVNQRARQRRPITQVGSEVSRNEDKNRISSDVTHRDRSFEDTPYFERGVSERQPSSPERVEAPYLERGGSARRRINIKEIRRENSADEYSEPISEDSNIRQVPDLSDQVQVQRRTVVRQRYSDVSTRIRTAEVDQTNSRSTEVSPEFDASSRSRSRSRLRSRVSASEPSKPVSAEPRAEEPTTFRQRGRSRLVVRPTARSEEEPRSNPRSLEVTDKTRSSSLGATGREYSRNSIRVASSSKGSSSSHSDNRRVEIDTKINEKQVFRVKFPKKNLIPGVPRIKIKEYQDIEDNSIYRTNSEIKPTKPRPIEEDEIEPDENPYEYEDTNIQSSKPEKDDFILVTHQVAAKTMFTVLEGVETKSLFIDTYTTSLQTVSIRSLQSTNIEDSTVIFANVHTSFGYGVQETLYDAIHPTRTTVQVSGTGFNRGPRNTENALEYSTIYNVQTVTVRNVDVQASLTPDINNIGSLLQNVLLGILGNNLLPGLGGLGGLGGPQIPGPPHTKLITHTRSFVSTTTSVDSLLVPVTFQGSQVFRTVFDTKTQVYTGSEVSVETIVEPGLVSSTPFLPLAQTLHRATRVVPTFHGLAGGLVQTQPLLTYFTHTSTSLTTIDADITSELTVTLGGREITTHFIQPSQQVLTVTSYSTQTVSISPSTQVQPNLNQLSLLQAILQLNRLGAHLPS